MIKANTNTLSKKEIREFKKALQQHDGAKIILMPKELSKTTYLGSVLHLSLKEMPFAVMVTGEKPDEYRVPTDWIRSRLYNKDGSKKTFDWIKFTHGYGAHRPYFICRFRGFYKNPLTANYHKYSNGLIVTVNFGDFIIQCGEIVEKGNLKA